VKQKLDQVTGHNAVIQFVLKVATVLALLYPGAPDTSPALYAAILAVLMDKTGGVESGGFRDLPKGKGVACKGVRSELGCVFWPGVKAADVIAAIKEIPGAPHRDQFALAVGNTLKDTCNQLARNAFVLRRRQLAELIIFLLRHYVTNGEYVKVSEGGDEVCGRLTRD
jgi:hypothetical protein